MYLAKVKMRGVKTQYIFTFSPNILTAGMLDQMTFEDPFQSNAFYDSI